MHYFSHEKIEAYRLSINLIANLNSLFELSKISSTIKSQIERSSVSIPLNIAEGNGKSSRKDRARFWQIALGSALETAAGIDVLFAKKLIDSESVKTIKSLLVSIVNLLMTMLKNLNSKFNL